MYRVFVVTCLAVSVIMAAGCDSRSSLTRQESTPVDEPMIWTVAGRVTDEQGQGLPGVRVVALCGWGTLSRTGEALTDENGHYRLNFRAGNPAVKRSALLDRSDVGLRAANIVPSKDGYRLKGETSSAQLHMAYLLPAPHRRDNMDAERIVLPGKTHKQDFVMVNESSPAP